MSIHCWCVSCFRHKWIRRRKIRQCFFLYLRILRLSRISYYSLSCFCFDESLSCFLSIHLSIVSCAFVFVSFVLNEIWIAFCFFILKCVPNAHTHTLSQKYGYFYGSFCGNISHNTWPHSMFIVHTLALRLFGQKLHMNFRFVVFQ